MPLVQAITLEERGNRIASPAEEAILSDSLKLVYLLFHNKIPAILARFFAKSSQSNPIQPVAFRAVTANRPIVGGTTKTGALVSVAPGKAGQVLTSAGGE